MLQSYAENWGADTLYDGARAVLARLVRTDPAHACNLIEQLPTPSEKIAWLESVVWWFSVPDQARPIIQELRECGDPDIDLALIRMLTRTGSTQLIAPFLSSSITVTPAERAFEFAPGICQLRAAGRQADAESVRSLVLPYLKRNASVQDSTEATAIFEVLSAPGIPTLVPWGRGPGLP